jgi:hypothetical protein
VALAVLVVVATCTACLPRDVGILADDSVDGRDAGTPGGVAARNWIVGQLRPITEGANPANGSGAKAYLQPWGDGRANIVAVIRGTQLPGEYVAVGGHYDHLGHRCPTNDPDDHICNGAMDNAAGVAAVLALARRLAQDPPRRSILITIWDGEEEKEAGSTYYVAHPVVPLAKTVTYLNADLLGENLTPGLRNTSFGIGAETGGARLKSMLEVVDHDSPLDLLTVSTVFGANRSDHALFIAEHVPTIFFGDGGGGCYHTAQDEVGVVDFDKLRVQTEMIIQLATTLADTHTLPKFVADPPVTTFADVTQFSHLLDLSKPDWPLFPEADQAKLQSNFDTVHRIVADGADQYGSDDVGAFLVVADSSSKLLTHLKCDGYLAPS